MSEATEHQETCVRLALLIKSFPDMLRFSLDYFEKNPAPWHEAERLPSSPKRQRFLDTFENDICEETILEAVLQYLQTSPEYFRSCWSWVDFTKKYINHRSPYLRWLACHCIAIVLRMSEVARIQLFEKLTSKDEVETAILKFAFKQFDCKISNAERSYGYNSDADEVVNCSFSELEESPDIELLDLTEILTTTVSIEGVLVPSVGPPLEDKGYIETPTLQQKMRTLATAVASATPMCIIGSTGCGKTSLVRCLAAKTGNMSAGKLYEVQLSEEMDSKLLLGSYRCTDIPGEFVWQAGVLTRAMLNGTWILFEDIDTAPNDVAILLSSLIERNSINVSGFRNNIVPKPGFQLFFTYRSNSKQAWIPDQQPFALKMLRKHCLLLSLDELSDVELFLLIKTKFPKLTTVASRMVSLANEFTDIFESRDLMVKSVGARVPSTRDLMKWCARSQVMFDVSSIESAVKIVQDAIDVYCANIMNPEVRLKMASLVVSRMGVVKDVSELSGDLYKPEITFHQDCIVAGRSSYKKNENENKEVVRRKYIFAFTSQSRRLLEQLTCCLSMNEPILLVGETGTGKTSTLQLLAEWTDNKLLVVNMNQDSDSADLLGGFKPVNIKFLMNILRNEFEGLFRKHFDCEQNLRFLEHISSCLNGGRWNVLLKLMKPAVSSAIKRASRNNEDKEQLSKWNDISEKIRKLEIQLKQKQTMTFGFVEGVLVKALRNGHWVLLDEINLASAETLQCLSGLFEMGGSVSLFESGNFEKVERHPNFRLMAAMNPPTDVGKKQLPIGIRNRFTEFYVSDAMDISDIQIISKSYLSAYNGAKQTRAAQFYCTIKQDTSLTDGTGKRPHFSLRTFCRALSVASRNPCNSPSRSFYEGFCLSFLTQLDSTSHDRVLNMIKKIIIGEKDVKSLLNQPIPNPSSNDEFVSIQGFWLRKGTLETVSPQSYILTERVEQNLRDLMRVLSLSDYPILIQGDTSVGKTSLISYIASRSGCKCYRINNHEHTDVQEYVGMYTADPVTGKLVFKEGVLVEAMRQGHWVILDELNLAPSDVLEALNRVLDDNRELFICETQTTVKAHPNFRLFATQNPAGAYAGRKVLSRAFRNRFVELHFGEIPTNELQIILQKRCEIPESYAKKMVAVMKELQRMRRGSAAFAGKQGFITLRDLFRWGERYRLANKELTVQVYDWYQHIACEGYLVLAASVRQQEERDIIKNVLERHIERKINVQSLFTLSEETPEVTRSILQMMTNEGPFSHIVWTYNMRKMLVLVGKALQFEEPILLVGDTGLGKTTICQMLATMRGEKLYSVNCHQQTEGSDFLGGLRPVRNRKENLNKLFEWVDGPLIEAMLKGCFFLADEISLADDSVLERLNSLLEPERSLLLTDKPGTDSQFGDLIKAHPNFRFISTMNPGGDFGKKELSPALRNRLTEIWCENYDATNEDDIKSIIKHNLKEDLNYASEEDAVNDVTQILFSHLKIGNDSKMIWSVRDVMSWLQFINLTARIKNDEFKEEGDEFVPRKLKLLDAAAHATFLVFSEDNAARTRSTIGSKMASMPSPEKDILQTTDYEVVNDARYFGFPVFVIKKGNESEGSDNFGHSNLTSKINCLRILRALQVPGKAVLLEGPPSSGKTTLIIEMAQAARFKLTRINLSEQTDVSDLFGSDLPVDGAEGGIFEWRDGPFLTALKNGHWILLDELNLASQSVLEALNAVLDHRGEVYIPELNQSFKINSDQTRLFATQNPQKMGGGRKGLPKSFLNRFFKIYVTPYQKFDIQSIMVSLYPDIDENMKEDMMNFHHVISEMYKSSHEINLRDLLRWCNVTQSYADESKNYEPQRFMSLLYAGRMRNKQEEKKVLEVFKHVVPNVNVNTGTGSYFVTPSEVIFDDITVSRECISGIKPTCKNVACSIDSKSTKFILRTQLKALRSLALCVKMDWMAILVGESEVGKTSIVRAFAQICNQELKVLSLSSATDTMDLLGGFEQMDYNRTLDDIISKVGELVCGHAQEILINDVDVEKFENIYGRWEQFNSSYRNVDKMIGQDRESMSDETHIFINRLSRLLEILECMKSFICCLTRISDLEAKLIKLKDVITKAGNLNSSGRFEWVDSVLVQCIREGRWILLEDANLCNPAVLDRLNSLLEPNGVLALTEKGVDMNRQITEVARHPSFRLFMTMDSKNGELSRPLRNRGVEIVILPFDDEKKYQMVSYRMDLFAMFNQLGLHRDTHRNLLLSLVELFDAKIREEHGSNANKAISLTELLRACFQSVQDWRHGALIKSAIKHATFDVFLKPRNFEPEKIMEFSATADAFTENFNKDALSLTLYNQGFCPFYNTSSSLTLQMDSLMARIRMESSTLIMFLHVIANSMSSSNKPLNIPKCINDIFLIYDVDFENNTNPIDLLMVCVSLLKMYYSRSSIMDIKLRHAWIRQLFDKIFSERVGSTGPMKNFATNFQKICNNYFNTIYAYVCDEEDPGRPLRKIYLPWDSTEYFDCKTELTWTTSINVHFRMEFVCLKFSSEIPDDIENENFPSSFLLQDFTAHTDEDSLKFVPSNQHPVTTSYHAFLKCSITVILAFISRGVLKDEILYARLLGSLVWYKRLLIGSNNIRTENSEGAVTVYEGSVKLMEINYKLFLKRTLRPILNIWAQEEDLNEIEEVTNLLEFIKNVENCELFELNPLASFSRKILKSYGLLSPVDEATFFQGNDKRIWGPSLSFPYQKSFNERNHLRNKLKEISSDSNHFKMVKSTLGLLYKRFIVDCLSHTNTQRFNASHNVTTDPIESLNEEQNSPTEDDKTVVVISDDFYVKTGLFEKEKSFLDFHNTAIELLPIWQMIAIRLEGKFRRQFYNQHVDESDKMKMAETLFNTMHRIPTTSKITLAFLFTCKGELVYKKNWRKLGMLFNVETVKRYQKMSCIGHYRDLLHPPNEEDAHPFEEQECMYMLQLPLLSTYVYWMTHRRKNNDFPSVYYSSFRDYPRRRKYLTQVASTFWSNSMFLSDQRMNVTKNEFMTLLEQYRTFENSIEKYIGQCYATEVDLMTPIIEKMKSYVLNSIIEFRPKLLETLSNFCKMTITAQKFIAYATTTLNNNFEGETIHDFVWLKTGKGFVVLGMAEYLLASILPPTDPMIVKQCSFFTYKCQADEMGLRIAAEKIFNQILGYNPEKKSINELVEGELRKHCIDGKFAGRKSNKSYEEIIKSLNNFNNLCIDRLLQSNNDLWNRMFEDCLHYLQNDANIDAQERNTLENSIKENVEICKLFCQQNAVFCELLIARYSPSYDDIIIPIVNALSKVIHGFNILQGIAKRILIRSEFKFKQQRLKVITDPHDVVLRLTKFPYVKSEDILQVFEVLREGVLDSVLQDVIPNSSIMQFRLLKSCFVDYTVMIEIFGNFGTFKKSVTWNTVQNLVNNLMEIWNCQQEKKEEKTKENENLYRFKTRTLCDPEEELAEDKELSRCLFGSVDDFKEYSENDEMEEDEEEGGGKITIKEDEMMIKNEDLVEIYELYSRIAHNSINTHWYKKENKQFNVDRNIQQSFVNRFYIAGLILDKYYTACSESMDENRLISLMYIVNVNLKANDNSSNDDYDFYHDSNPKQTAIAIPVFSLIKDTCIEIEKINKDHPILRNIMEVVDRVMSFDVSSPISRFMEGAEILHCKTHEWATLTHSKLDFKLAIEELNQLIIKWRELEISQWKKTLQTTARRVKSASMTWWIQLMGVCKEYLNEVITNEELVVTLEKFLNTSTIADHELRLSFMMTLHCAYVDVDSSPRLEELSNMLWNMFHYFDIKMSRMNETIEDMKKSIHRELDNLLKIISWQDVNYWTMKQSIQKVHKTIFKYVKQYKTLMEKRLDYTKAKPYERFPSNGYQIISARKNEIDNQLLLNEELIENDDGLLPKINGRSFYKMLNKAKKLIAKSDHGQYYRNLVNVFKDESFEMLTCVQTIMKLTVDEGQSKEKKKSQAKHLQQRKRKMISDMFKLLQKLGFSYKTGLLNYNQDKILMKYCTLQPSDVKVAMDILSDREIFEENVEEMTDGWESCNKNFIQSVLMERELSSNIKLPHKDLNPGLIDRIKGFSANFMNLAMEQKSHLSAFLKSYYELRINEAIIRDAFIGFIPPRFTNELITVKDKLLNEMKHLHYYLKQQENWLNIYPDIDSDIPVPRIGPSLYGSCDNDFHDSKPSFLIETRRKANKTIMKSIEEIEENLKGLKPFKREISPSIYNNLITRKEYKSLIGCTENLKIIITNINKVDLNYSNPNNVEENPMTINLRGVRENLDKLLECIVNGQNEMEKYIKKEMEGEKEVVNSEGYTKSMENVSENILMVIQKIYKKYDDMEEPVMDDLQDSHLKRMIIENLNNDFNAFNMGIINENLVTFIIQLQKQIIPSKFDNGVLRLVTEYRKLVTYFIVHYIKSFETVNEINSFILQIFNDFTRKGWDIPEELMSDEEQKQSSDKSNGMGLVDEEGIKDVSDQIESQDELEGAKPEGQENEEEQKDCKEEENGVEMSDDFGGKSQQLEGQDEDDDEDNEEQDQDLDMEMGETGEEAEILDEKLWGSDGEDEVEGEMDELEGNDKSGKNKEMGAKDDRNDKTAEGVDDEDDDKTADNNSNEKEINEMKEPVVDEDHIDPYHGKHEPEPEPEPMDLPDDMQLDGDEGNDGEDKEEENPFDIDAMKEKIPTEQQASNDGGEEESEEKNNEVEENEKMETDETGDNEEMEKDEDTNNDVVEKNDDGEEVGGEDEGEENGEKPKGDESKSANDKPSAESAISEEKADGSNDQACEGVDEKKEDKECSSKAEEDNVNDTKGAETEGVGKAEQVQDEKDKGHFADRPQGSKGDNKSKNREEKRKLQIGQEDDKRTLSDNLEPKKKRCKTIDSNKEKPADESDVEKEVEEAAEESENQADMYRHVEGDENDTTETLDIASQAHEQPVLNMDNEEADKLREEEEVKMEEDKHVEEDAEHVNELLPEQVNKSNEERMTDNKQRQSDETDTEHANLTIPNKEDDIVDTMNVERPFENAIYTRDDDFVWNVEMIDDDNLLQENNNDESMETENTPVNVESSLDVWNDYVLKTSELSQELSEQLRLVLQPTQASRFRGDFRSGRRINMKKVIPYIASQFRKDKIWLRRTKPSKRQYQIILAIDDSRSMMETNSNTWALQSMALVSTALNLIEAGELGIISFGETTKVVHELSSSFTPEFGAKVVAGFEFNQEATRVGGAIKKANRIFSKQGCGKTAWPAQLLVIVSDGRGTKSEGADVVKTEIKNATANGILIVFIVLDSPDASCSILDIKVPEIKNGKFSGMASYMDEFPFPYYMIVRDIQKLPSVLGEALRQWFELTTNISQ